MSHLNTRLEERLDKLEGKIDAILQEIIQQKLQAKEAVPGSPPPVAVKKVSSRSPSAEMPAHIDVPIRLLALFAFVSCISVHAHHHNLV